MPASYPSSAKAFVTKNTGDTVQADHINDLQLEVTAVENDLIGGLPVARGGTGLTAVGASGTIPQSNGSALSYTASPTLTAVTAGTVTSTGQVVISGASAGQIVFPATQNASTNANTLDDYEEGTWTPVLGGSGGTSGQAYAIQVGRYVKIGKLVTCYFNIQLSTLGTVTTNAQIQGLPFTAENTSNQRVPLLISHFSAMTSNVVFLGGYVEPNTTAATLTFASAAATNAGVMAQADFSNNTVLVGSVTFVATA